MEIGSVNQNQAQIQMRKMDGSGGGQGKGQGMSDIMQNMSSEDRVLLQEQMSSLSQEDRAVAKEEMKAVDGTNMESDELLSFYNEFIAQNLKKLSSQIVPPPPPVPECQNGSFP